MDWNAIGAIGEILGATGVIVTLGYLAVQIRASTSQSQAAMVQSIVGEFNVGHTAVMSNLQLAEAFVKNQIGEDVSAAEQIQLESALNSLFNIYTSVQRAYDGGQLDHAYYETCCGDIVRACEQNPGWEDSFRELLSHYPQEAKQPIFAGLLGSK